jgi:hypothetical protein
MIARSPDKIGDPITDEEWSNQHPARRAMIEQSVVNARPNTSITVEDVPGNEIIMSGGTVVLVLAGDTEPADHGVIVGSIVKLLALCSGTGVDPAHTAQKIKMSLTIEDHLNRIADLRCNLDMAEMALLNERGWKHTSSTPDHCWRWVKEFDGKTLMIDRAQALHIEGAGDS